MADKLISLSNLEIFKSENDKIYAPSSHDHTISNVDGLQTALDAKLPKTGGTVSNLNSILATATTNTVITPNATAIASSPFARDLWHNRLSFISAVTSNQVTTTAGVTKDTLDDATWTDATDSANIKNLFANKENQTISILTSTQTARRFVIQASGSLHACAIEWLQMTTTYASPYCKTIFVVETTSDQATWTQIATGTLSSSTTPYFIKNGSSWSNVTHIRFTFIRATDAASNSTFKLAIIKGLTKRKGDQGQGIEYEFPYTWDADKNMTMKGTLTGTLKGNADTATKLGSSTVGSVTQPIYLKEGTPTQCTLSASDVGALPDTTVIPDALADLSSDATHRTVSDTEKATWNAKSTFSGSYTDLTNVPTTFTPNEHDHDDLYYTEQEIDSKLSGKANTSHGTHVTFGTTAPKANGTAAVGTATTVSRSDHVHPVQTSVSGNAGTATKLASAKTISLTGDVSGSVSFDGSDNVSITTTVADDSHNHVISNVDGLEAALDGKVPTTCTINSKALSANITLTASDVGAIATSQKGAAGGVAELDSSGKIPTTQLPSYVDDVIEATSQSNFPTTGETGKIYVDTTTNKTYRWSGSAYIEISASLALGTTSSTAYRGDYGNTAYTHSQKTSGNPHKVSLSDFDVTATATELNYVDGVTSNIQTQLNDKAPKSHASTATTYGAASASNYGHAMASSTTPKANGTAAVGSETAKFARGDHVHPLQTTVSGNAGTATKLATARTISLTGDVTGSGSFDGSGDLAITATVANDSHTHSAYLPLSGGTMDDGKTIKLSTYGNRFVTISGNSIIADMSNTTGGWAGSFASVKHKDSSTESGTNSTTMLGWYGSATGLTHIFMGGTYSDPALKMTPAGQFTFKNTPKVGSTNVALATNATTSAAGLMSASDKVKLDGIAEGAQVNTITGVKGSAESSYRTGNINITAANLGLGNVENKSSATIRGEITGANVTDALGYIPLDVAEIDSLNDYILELNTSDASELTQDQVDEITAAFPNVVIKLDFFGDGNEYIYLKCSNTMFDTELYFDGFRTMMGSETEKVSVYIDTAGLFWSWASQFLIDNSNDQQVGGKKIFTGEVDFTSATVTGLSSSDVGLGVATTSTAGLIKSTASTVTNGQKFYVTVDEDGKAYITLPVYNGEI